MTTDINRRPVKVEGAKEVRARLRRLHDATDRANARGELRRLHIDLAEMVKARAVQLVPERTGRLKATIRASGTQKGGRVRAGFKRVPYAGPIHFGWAALGITPQPFLYEALDDRRSEVYDAYVGQLERMIKAYGLD